MPRYQNHHFHRTMFVAEKSAVLTCSTLEGFEKNAPNIFSTDHKLINCIQQEFQKYLAICRPLMKIFSPEHNDSIVKLKDKFIQIKSNTVMLDTLPTPYITADSLLDKFLSAANISENDTPYIVFDISHPNMTDSFWAYAEELANIKSSYKQQKTEIIQELKAML